MSAFRARRRKAMSEINVVPYIDVMLVLLVIFMITAPLLQQGVDIELPESAAEPLETADEPVLVNVARDGTVFLSVGGENEEVDRETLVAKVSAFIRANPEVPVLIGADKGVEYNRVYQTMVQLQQAGVPRVGLMSDPVERLPDD